MRILGEAATITYLLGLPAYVIWVGIDVVVLGLVIAVRSMYRGWKEVAALDD